MSVVLDAMGGDHAPVELVAGALAALPRMTGELHLVGDLAVIEPLLPAHRPDRLHLVHASESVDMDEKPTDAYRKKKDSSLLVAVRMVKEGRAGALVAAGNTGAAVAFSLLTWRPTEGYKRPAIGARMPNRHGGFMLLDAGASPDPDPDQIVEFARMGRAYARRMLGRENPKVHLLNIGEEPGKGNAFAKAVFEKLVGTPGFAGNIEGSTMWEAECDVVVCDAFVGNIVLKTSEGMVEFITNTVRRTVKEDPEGLAEPVGRAMRHVRQDMDWAEFGGSPLLGLDGNLVIAHGRSDRRAIANALLFAERAADRDLVAAIRDEGRA